MANSIDVDICNMVYVTTRFQPMKLIDYINNAANHCNCLACIEYKKDGTEIK